MSSTDTPAWSVTIPLTTIQHGILSAALESTVLVLPDRESKVLLREKYQTLVKRLWDVRVMFVREGATYQSLEVYPFSITSTEDLRIALDALRRYNSTMMQQAELMRDLERVELECAVIEVLE